MGHRLQPLPDSAIFENTARAATKRSWSEWEDDLTI
jgi:hypothetical protein